MRLPVLLLSAASLALGACGNDTSVANAESAQFDPGTEVSDKDLEDRVMAALDNAPRHGLTRDLFVKGELPPEGADRRQALLEIASDYASALANGKVDPAKIRDVYTVPRPKVDVSAGLKQALQQNKLAEWLESLAPQTDEYRALSDAFVELVKRTPGLPDTEIPGGETIKPGASDPRIPAIAANLRAQGYLGEPKPGQEQSGGGNRYTPQLVEAVRQWQADSGLKTDGIIGNNTIQALNSSPRDRARTLAVAMERLRWLERDPPATRIDVNTAAAILDYYRDGQHRDRRRVVVGQPGWETPALGSPIHALVANPDWVVPDSIVEEEISKKSSAWLKENNFTQENGRWVQQPGPDSALGLVKFAMRNDHAIYLHDTPAKALFQQDNRHESHGCVRVHNAVEFAQMLAQDSGIADKFSQAMAKDEETQVPIGTEIPVRLLYHTAWLDNGRVRFATDAYGWDNDVASALGYDKRTLTKAKHKSGDVGP